MVAKTQGNLIKMTNDSRKNEILLTRLLENNGRGAVAPR